MQTKKIIIVFPFVFYFVSTKRLLNHELPFLRAVHKISVIHLSVLHKMDSAYKKKAKTQTMPISTIRAMNQVKKKGWVSQHTVKRMAWIGKNSPRMTTGELQRLVGSWGQKVWFQAKIIYSQSHPKTINNLFN